MKRYKLGDTIFCVCGYVIMIVTFILNPFNFDSNLPLDARAGVLKKETLKFLRSCEIIENSETVKIQKIQFTIYLCRDYEAWITDGVFTVVDDNGKLCEHEFMVKLDYVYDEGITSRYLWLDYDISYYE